MLFHNLKLRPETALFLQFLRTPDKRESSSLIGYVKGRSILVTTPMVGDSPRPTKVGEKLNVRFFAEANNAAGAFASEVIHVTVIPFPHLHLGYPGTIESDAVRKSTRVNTDLVAAASVNNRKIACTIANISTTGCRLKSLKSLGEPGDKIAIATKLEVADKAHVVTLKAIIMAHFESVDEQGRPENIIGVDFFDLDDNSKLIVHGFVYYHLK